MTKYDKRYVEALFNQVQSLVDENERLKKDIEFLKNEINGLEVVVSVLNPTTSNGTVN